MVRYAIGGADIIFKDFSYISEETRPKTVFAMSNLINVLAPDNAWKILKVIVSRMKKGDKFVITNLAKEQFIKKTRKYYEDTGKYNNRIFQFNKLGTSEHYKSAIDSEFSNAMLNKFSNLSLQDEKLPPPMKCNIIGKDGNIKKLDVQFRTILFEVT